MRIGSKCAALQHDFLHCSVPCCESGQHRTVRAAVGIQSDSTNDDRFLAHPMGAWVKNSISARLLDNQAKLLRIHGVAECIGKPNLQRAVAALVWPTMKVKSAGAGLLRPVKYHVPGTSDNYAEYIEKIMMVCGAQLPRVEFQPAATCL